MPNETAPPPPPDGGSEAEEAAWEMATAETLRGRGELADAATWYRRAANHLMEAGDDERAISVAKLAAELAALDDAGRGGTLRGERNSGRPVEPPPAAPQEAQRPQAQRISSPSAVTAPPPPPAAPARPSMNEAAGGQPAKQKLPWQRSSRPAPPRPAARMSSPAVQPGPTSPTNPARAQAARPPVSAPARPPAPSASSPLDDIQTSQLDVQNLGGPLPDDEVQTVLSPLAALVDEAVSDLRDPLVRTAIEEETHQIHAHRGAVSSERLGETDHIAARLPALPLFAELTADQVRVIARQAGSQNFDAGDNITEAGAPEGPMFVIVDGEARVVVAGDESRPVTLGAGDFVGEISAVYGGPRMATVVASGLVETVALPPSMVRWMIQAIPSFGDAVMEAIRDRVLATLPLFAPMFWHLAPAQRREAFTAFELAVVEAGEALLIEGQPPEALYVVAAGEVELYGGTQSPSRPLRARAGEALGVVALHTGEAAMATVRASRRTLVARLPAAKYGEMIARYPRLAEAAADAGNPGRGVLC